MRFNKLAVILVVLAAIGLFAVPSGFYTSGCSGTQTGADTSVIRGIVMTPTSSSGNLSASKSAGLTVKALSDVAQGGVSGRIYTIAGELIGEFTTDASGAFEIVINLSAIRPLGTVSSTWTQDIIIDTDAGIQKYAQITVTDGATPEIDLGAANSDTTLATQAVAAAISGFSGWNNDYSTIAQGIDMQCLFDVQNSLWENVSATGSGIIDDGSMIKQLIIAYMANGGKPATLGFGTWNDLMQAAFAGTLSGEQLTIITSLAGSTISGFTSDRIIAGYATAATAMKAVDSILSAQFALGGLGVSQIGELSDTSLCDKIRRGTFDPDIFIKPILAATDTSSLQGTFGANGGFAVFVGVLERCQTNGTCSNLTEKPGAYFGFLSGYGGNFSDIYNNGMFTDATKLDGIIDAPKTCIGDTREELMKCGQAVYGTVYTGGGGDWGSFSDAQLKCWSAYWSLKLGEGFDPTLVSGSYYSSAYAANKDLCTESVARCASSAGTDRVELAKCFSNEFKDFDDFSGWQGTISAVGPNSVTLVTGLYSRVRTDTSSNCQFAASFDLQTSADGTYYLTTSGNVTHPLTYNSTTCQFQGSLSDDVETKTFTYYCSVALDPETRTPQFTIKKIYILASGANGNYGYYCTSSDVYDLSTTGGN